MRMPQMMRLATVISACLMMFAQACPTLAQGNPFAPRIYVNDRAVTEFELAQRMRFMQLLRAPGATEEIALKNLIEDRLRLTAAKQLGLAATPAQVQAGMEEFAARANLTADVFVTELGKAGVEAQTFRDFVEAGVIWRDVVRMKFGARANITEAEIDRAITAASQQAAVTVQVSELVIAAPAGQEVAAMAEAIRLKAELNNGGNFGALARSHSAAASAARGGRLDWMPLANLPPTIAPFIMALSPGEVSEPVAVTGGVALFQLQALQALPQPAPTSVTVDYAQFLVPNDGNAEAELARLRLKADSCNDLYGLAKGLPAEQLLRETKPLAEVPPDVALELARLDAGESSTALVRGGARVLLMLCARAPLFDVAPTRAAMRAQLVNQRLAGYADDYLADLRANAIIRQP